MKVLITSPLSSKNKYVDLITKEYDQKIDYVCSIDSFWNSDEVYDLIHIQWPEELLGWNEVKQSDLNKLVTRLEQLKEKGTKIIYTLHNLHSHRSWKNDDKLYGIIQEYSDGVIHLGHYSCQNFFRKKKSIVIKHPIYFVSENTQTITSNIQANQRTRFLVFGSIRNKKEFDFLIKAFNHQRLRENSELIILDTTGGTSNIGILNRVKLKISFFRKYFFLKNNIIIKKGILSEEELAKYIQNADFVIIPRLSSLNSGILFKSIAYGKKVVGPAIGNIKEELDAFSGYTYSTEDYHSLQNLMMSLKAENEKTVSIDEHILKEHSPALIASKHIDFYKELIECRNA
jgi:glycosyltransferase involved in cell wall biosynthesis